MQEREEKEKIVNYGLIHIVDNDRDIKTIFNKKAYETEFLAFYDIYSQGLAAYNSLYEMSSKPEEYAREVALKIMAYEMEKINGITKNQKRDKDDGGQRFYSSFCHSGHCPIPDAGYGSAGRFPCRRMAEKFPEKSDSAGRF